MHVAPHLKPFMEAHPDLAIHLVLSDEFTDIVGGGFDLAIRIANSTIPRWSHAACPGAPRTLCIA